ncbi:MAG: PPC domain-containing protein [Acetatifactor sp.]
MKKTTKKIIFILVFVVLLIAGMFVGLFCYNQEGFTGSRVKNPDAYMLDIERMNGTDLHTLDLQTGDVLQIHFETVKGALYMEMKAPDGTTIYRGNGKETTDFTVNIPESGVYTVAVESLDRKSG